MITGRYTHDASDIDLEASLPGLVAARAERRLIDSDELRVRRWAEPETAWCLLVDRSGSMHGQALANAAMAASAIALRADERYAVLAFARAPIAVKAMWEHRSDVIDRLLALRGTGTTDVAAALNAAADQFRSTAATRCVTVLLSDCRSSEPGDAMAAARQLSELYILAPSDDPSAAIELAAAAEASWATVDGPTSIADAIGRLITR